MDTLKLLETILGMSDILTADMLEQQITKIVTAVTIPILLFAIINCFLGYRIFRVIVTISGTMIAGAAGCLIAIKTQSVTWIVASILICALVGGFAAYKLYMAGAFIMGFFTEIGRASCRERV